MKTIFKWQIYIPEEGHWPIPGNPKNKAEARINYLKQSGRKRLPKGSVIRIENKI